MRQYNNYQLLHEVLSVNEYRKLAPGQLKAMMQKTGTSAKELKGILKHARKDAPLQAYRTLASNKLSPSSKRLHTAIVKDPKTGKKFISKKIRQAVRS